MPTSNADFEERTSDSGDNGDRDVWVIALTLSWCVIRIELPRRLVDERFPPPSNVHFGSRSNAWRRRPAMAKPSPRAAARTGDTTGRASAQHA